jgi:hypothetical protein
MKKTLLTLSTIFALNTAFSQDKKILVYSNVDRFEDKVSMKFNKKLSHSMTECKIKTDRIFEYRHVQNFENDTTIIKGLISQYKPTHLMKFTLTDKRKPTNTERFVYGVFARDVNRIEIEFIELASGKIIDRNVVTNEQYSSYFNELKYNKIIE